MGQGIGGTHDEATIPLRIGIKTLYPNMAGLAGAMLGVGAGAPAPVEYGAVGQTTIPLTTGDEIFWTLDLEELPIDLSRDIQVEPVLISTETIAAANGATLDFHVQGVALGQDIPNPKTLADASIQWTGVGATASQLFKPGKRPLLAATIFTNDDLLSCAFTCNSQGSFTNDLLKLVAVRLFYTQLITDASGIRQET